jgi:putative DNA primase/helicase
LATLAGKRIALCSESSSTKNLLEDATIKALVAGDKMQVRQIKREPFILEPQVKLWWSMNRLPAVADTSHGMWRRIVMIPFNRIFDEKTRIRDLKDRLDRELPGIFNWCLEGYARIKAEGKFSYCQQAQVLKDDFQFESNTVRLFIDDCCVVNDDKVKNLSDTPSRIYNTYKIWTKLMNYHSMSNRSFKQEMESLRYEYIHSGDRRWHGLMVSDEKCKSLGITNDPWEAPKNKQQTTLNV